MSNDVDALKKRVGKLLSAARHKKGLTQQQLATEARISFDMVAKIEGGATGVRFPFIVQLSQALGIDPGELFMVPGHTGAENVQLNNLTAKLATLSPAELAWITGIVDAALKSKH